MIVRDDMKERRPEAVHRWRSPLRLALALLSLCIPLHGLAQSTVPANLRAAILLRALQYEKAFAAETSTAVVIVLGGDAAGDGGKVAAALQALVSKSEQGRKIEVKELRGAVNGAELRAAHPAAVYVAAGNESALAVAVSTTGAIVLCGDPAFVGKGCTMSVEAAEGASRLVVDLTAAERAGQRFDPRLLRLSRVIR